MNPKSYDRDKLDVNQQTIIDMMTPGSTVLEVGPATGFMTRHMTRELGCMVVAVEIDPDQAVRARPFAETMIVGDIESPEVWTQLAGLGVSFDYVIFSDVLEHLKDPWEALRKCKAILKDGGSVLASIPNVAYYRVRLDLLFGRFDYTEFGILDDTHLRFFTAKTVRELFSKAGYRVDELASIFRRCKNTFGRVFANALAYQFIVKASVSETEFQA